MSGQTDVPTRIMPVACPECGATGVRYRNAYTSVFTPPPGHAFITEHPLQMLCQIADVRNHDYDEQTVEVIRRVVADGDTCIDVGAHTGDVLQFMVEASPSGRHLAFEPLPELAQGLRAAFPQVSVNEVALSATVGEISFQRVRTNPAYSGILLRKLDRAGETVETITVATRPLDDFTEDLPVRLLKVDVEGAEFGVFSSAGHTIARTRPYVVFEHGLGGADVYGTTPDQMYDLFDSWDYDITLMANWLDGRPALIRADFIDAFDTGSDFYFMALPRIS